MATTKRRTGIIKYIGNVIDETKDLVDDILDRARDVEHDVRDTARKLIEADDEGDEDDTVREQDITELKTALLDLTRKVDELAALQQKNKSSADPRTS